MTRLRRWMVRLLLLSCSTLRLLARVMPSKLLLPFGAAMGRLVGFFCKKDQLLSIAQLRFAFPEGFKQSNGTSEGPASNHAEVRAISEQAFSHMGESVAELLIWERFFKGPAASQRISLVGDDIPAELRDSKQGALGLSGHFGSFELLAAYLAHRGLRCSVIGRSPNYSALEKAIREFRLAYGVEVIWSESSEAPRQIIQAMRGGRVVCALIDQDTKWKSEYSPFFGLDAASPSGPISLALRYKVPIFTAFIRRTARMCHEVDTRFIQESTAEGATCRSVLGVFNTRLEDMIRRDPGQYLWWHRRWRRRPETDYNRQPDLLPSTEQYLAWLKQLATERASETQS